MNEENFRYMGTELNHLNEKGNKTVQTLYYITAK